MTTSLTTGSPSTTSSTTGTPSYLNPFLTQNIANMWGLSQTPYQAYQGQQNANFTGLQNQSFNEAGQLTGSPQTAQASGIANQAASNLLGTNYNGMQAGYQNINSPQLNSYQMNGPGMVGTQGFNNDAAAQLMNPYIQQSLAPQLQLLQQQQGIQGTQLAGQATQAGAFGGSRYGIQQGLQNQGNQLAQSNLVGNAYNTAFTNAQNQFNTQQQLGLQAQTANQNANLATGEQNLAAALGVQSLGAQQNLAAQQANQQAGLTAQQANINQQQFGANLGLQANQGANSAANTLGQLGQNAYAQNVGTIGLQNQLGGQQQQYQQGLLNTQYQNYVNQLNYPYQQASYFQNAINGYPTTSSTSTTQPSSPSTLQNATSLALAGYGINNITNGGFGNWISSFFADGGAVGSYKKGGVVKGYADGSLTSISSALSPLPTSNQSTLQKAIAAASARGDTETAAALQTELDTQGYIGQQTAKLGQVATPGAPQAGSYGVNPNANPITPGTGAGRSGAPSPSSASGSSNALPSLEDILKLKQYANEAKIAAALPNTQSIAADASNVPSLNTSPPAGLKMPGVSVGPSLDSARGGLQYVPLSDSVLPTVSKKRGGITDVAGYDGDEASLTELDTPVETFKSPEAKEAMLAKSISDAASASARPEQSFITPPPQPAMQAPAPASMGPGPGPSNAPMPAPAPSPAPNAPAPMLASNKPQALQQGIQGLSAAVAAPTNYASLMTQEQQAAMRQQLAEEHAKAAGQEPYTDAQKALAARIAAHPAEDQRMQGLAALMAIPGILSGNQAGRGLAQGASDYAKNMMALKADQEKRDQAEIAMNLHLTESQRADKLGHWVYGMQGTKDYVKEGHEVDALNEKILKDKAEMAKWEAVAGKADKVTQPRGLTASEERLQEIDALSAQIKDEHPDWNPAKIRAEAVKQRGTFGPSLVTSQTTATTAANKLTTEETDKRRKEAQDLWVVGLDPKTKKYYKDTFGGNAPNQYYDDYVNGKVQSPTGAPATKPAAAPVVMDKHVPASLPPLTVMYQGKQFTFPDKASYDAYMAKLNGR